MEESHIYNGASGLAQNFFHYAVSRKARKFIGRDCTVLDLGGVSQTL